MQRHITTLAAAVVIAGGLIFAAMAGAGVGFSASDAQYGPDCSDVRPSLSTLNATGRFVKVTLSGATESENDPLTYTITSVTQDEPVNGPPGVTGPDAIRATDDPASVLLRGERDPRGDGRVYTIAYTVSSENGQCSGTVDVEVRRKATVPAVQGPSKYDSFTGASA